MPATTKAVSVFTTDQVKQKQTRQRQNIRNKYASRSTLLDHYTWCHLYLEDVVYVYVYTGLCGSILVHVYMSKHIIHMCIHVHVQVSKHIWVMCTLIICIKGEKIMVSTLLDVLVPLLYHKRHTTLDR